MPGPGHAVTAEVYQPWLEGAQVGEGALEEQAVVRDLHMVGEAVDHGDHVHERRLEVEEEAVRREEQEEDRKGEECATLLRRVLESKGVVDAADLARVVSGLDTAGRLMMGSKLVARAWCDARYRTRLLEDGNSAAAELGVEASNSNAPTKLVVVAQSAAEHHLVVCTLCSCYPLAVLGMAPPWYKSRSYRARAVRQPRAVLREFGLEVPEGRRLVVHDSTADCR